VQIGFGNLPNAVLLGGIRESGAVGTGFHRFFQQVRRELVHSVAVFALFVMPNGNQRPVIAQLSGDEIQQSLPGEALLLIKGIGILHVKGVIVGESAKHRVIPHTHSPQTPEHFVNPDGGDVPVVGEINHLHPFALLGGIPGEKSREKQLLVVSVGG